MTAPRIDWAALIDEPALFATLPADAQDAVYAQVAALEAACRARLLTRADGAPAASPEPERVLRLADAAQRLGMTKDFLHRHWRKLGALRGYLDADGRVKFPSAAVARHLATGAWRR